MRFEILYTKQPLDVDTALVIIVTPIFIIGSVIVMPT